MKQILCAATVLKAARSAGFDAITLFPQQYLDARRREKLTINDMRAMLRDHQMVVETVDPLLDWFNPQPSQSEDLLFDIAEALGAKTINAAPAFAPELSHAELVDIFSQLCERAARRGLRVDLEFLPWTVIPNFSTALDIVEVSAQRNAGITFDCLHFYRSGGDIVDLSNLSSEQALLISNIQLCDILVVAVSPRHSEKLSIHKGMLISAWDGIRVMGLKAMLGAAANAHASRPDSTDLMQEASYGRLLPGEGDIPLTDILNTLRSLGATPDIGPEIFSLEFNKLEAFEAAEIAMTASRDLVKILC